MLNIIKQFKKNESGAAMVEYAIALLVAAAIGVTTFSTMGTQAAVNSSNACDALMGSADAAGC